MSDTERQARAQARRERATLLTARLGHEPRVSDGLHGAAAVSLVYLLTRTGWALSGQPCQRTIAAIRLTDLFPERMNDRVPADFHDLLIELSDAGAEFVLIGGHAAAFHGHVRATDRPQDRADIAALTTT